MLKPWHFSASEPTCRLSDPAELHKLCRRTDPPLSQCYTCKRKHKKGHEYYYFCATCNLQFHRYCHLLLPHIKHPFHLSHPLTLISKPSCFDLFFDSSKNDDDDGYFGGWYNSCSEDDSDEKLDQLLPYDFFQSCKCCQRPLEEEYYHCSICNFFLNATCSKSIPPLTISHHKSHEHTLTFFPRRLPLPCDACGESLESIKDVVYACLPCNYMLHSKCIYLPRLIKITRHQHRLSYTSSLPPFFGSCGVCRKSVNINCGQYSCSKGCDYVVHSKCATRKDVWDGKDLEEIPEEPEEDVVAPFVRIDEETIQHFSHEKHHLKLHKNINIYGETQVL